MNTESPMPLNPQSELTKPSTHAGKRTSLFWMITLGVILLLGTAAIGIQSSRMLNLIPFGLAALASFVSVFFKAYRGIFFGFYITLGVVILAAILIYFIAGPNQLYPTHSPNAGI